MSRRSCAPLGVELLDILGLPKEPASEKTMGNVPADCSTLCLVSWRTGDCWDTFGCFKSPFHHLSDDIVVVVVSGVRGENCFSQVLPSLSASLAFAAATARLGSAGTWEFSSSLFAIVFDLVRKGVVI